jgi:hypothetical protein
MIDGSCIRVHQHGATLKRGPTSLHGTFPGRPDDEDHALVDGRGRPIRLHLPEGQRSDCTQAEPMLDTLTKDSTLLADEAYDTTPSEKGD